MTLGHYREVRYERLVTEPEAVLRELCGFLGLDFDESMLRAHERAHERLAEPASARLGEDGRVQLAGGGSVVARSVEPPDPSRIGRWREALSDAEVERFERVAGDRLAALGYETVSRPAPRPRPQTETGAQVDGHRAGPLRVVLATHRFATPGGTESYVLTVARELTRLGHHPVISAEDQGPMADHAERNGIPVARAPAELPADCSVVFAHDAIAAAAIGARYPNRRLVYFAHSDLFDHQSRRSPWPSRSPPRPACPTTGRPGLRARGRAPHPSRRHRALRPGNRNPQPPRARVAAQQLSLGRPPPSAGRGLGGGGRGVRPGRRAHDARARRGPGNRRRGHRRRQGTCRPRGDELRARRIRLRRVRRRRLGDARELPGARGGQLRRPERRGAAHPSRGGRRHRPVPAGDGLVEPRVHPHPPRRAQARDPAGRPAPRPRSRSRARSPRDEHDRAAGAAQPPVGGLRGSVRARALEAERLTELAGSELERARAVLATRRVRTALAAGRALDRLDPRR